ncbi:hypothetical protein L0Y46_02320 [bacterium]|nr:hypothetical protein [bacterium]
MAKNIFLRKNFHRIIIAAVLFIFCAHNAAAYVASSANYRLERDSMNAMGRFGQSSNYIIEDTGGESGTGRGESDSFIVNAGYQQSASVTATPPPPSSPPPSSSSGGGGGGTVSSETATSSGTTESESDVFQITDVLSAPTSFDAEIAWKTSRGGKSTLSWGETNSFELGTLFEDSFLEEHSMRIGDLTPGKTYFFLIEAVDSSGMEAAPFTGSFETPLTTDTEPPANVRNFSATPVPNDMAILLEWRNPDESDFDGVRIMRSESFYPLTPFEGSVAYDSGDSESLLDRNVKEGVRYYYTAFARDRSGFYSSGAIASAIIGKPFPEIFGPILPPSFPPDTDIHEIPITPPEIPDERVRALSIGDFRFIQKGEELPFVGGAVYIVRGENLTIELDYERVPEILKTIALTFVDPEESEKTFTFLLHVNREKTKYEATIAPLPKSGSYTFFATILDFENQAIGRVSGTVNAEGIFPIEEGVFEFPYAPLPLSILAAAFVLFIIIGLLVIMRRKRKKRDA